MEGDDMNFELLVYDLSFSSKLKSLDEKCSDEYIIIRLFVMQVSPMSQDKCINSVWLRETWNQECTVKSLI